MFKKLREKLADEAVGEEVKDQEFPSDNLSVSLSNEQQFSITEDDGTSSEMGSPQRDMNPSTSSSKAEEPDAALFMPILDNHNNRSTYIPPSDLESEVDERIPTPPTLDDSITKEQLFLALTKLHARVQRYKAKYSKVAEACKTANTEKEKIMRTLAANQDQMLRRMSELREQCNLEKQAKAHLEENLRLMLDEKEDMIGVLKTKIDLLKGGQNPDLIEEDVKSTKSIDSFSISEDQDSDKKSLRSQDENSSRDSESVTTLENKVKRLEELLSRCKNALQSNKERSEQITLERDRLADQLEKKEQELQKIQEEESTIQSNLRTELSEMSERLIKLRKEQEEMGMAMAETKRSFHQELETREQRLTDTQMDLNKAKEELTKITQQYQEECSEVQTLSAEVERITKTLDEEKNELIEKLSESKSAAILLLKEQHLKSLKDVEDEWKQKIEESERSYLSLIEKEKETGALLRERTLALECSNEESNKIISDQNSKIEKLTMDLDTQHQHQDKLEEMTKELNIQRDKCEDLGSQIQTLIGENNSGKEELEKTRVENQNLKKIEISFEELKTKCQDSETSSSTELEKILAEKNSLREKFLKLNSSMESLVSRMNDTTSTNSDLNRFISSIEETTLPLFNMFDDLELDKSNLDVYGQSLRSVIERLVSENVRVNKEIDNTKNLIENQTQLMEKLKSDKDSAEASLHEMTQSLNKNSEALQEAESKLKSLQSNSENETELRNNLSTALSDLDALKEELNGAKAQLEKSMKEYEKLRFNFDEMVSCNECKEMEIHKELDTLRTNLSSKQIELNTMNEGRAAFDDQIARLKSTLEIKDADISDLQLKLSEQEDFFKGQRMSVEQDLAHLRNHNEELIELKTSDEKEIEQLKAVLESTRNDISKKDHEIASLKENSQSVENEISNLNSKLDSDKQSLRQLTTQLETVQSEKDSLIKSIELGTSGNETLSKELESYEKKVKHLELDNMEKSNALLKIEDQLAKLTTELNVSESKVSDLQRQGEDFQTTLFNKTDYCETLEKQLVEVTRKSENMLRELEVNDEKMNEVEEECLRLREECGESKTILLKLNEIRSELNELQREKVELETTFSERCASYDDEKLRATNRISELDGEIVELKNQSKSYEEKCHQLEAQISTLIIEKVEFENNLTEQSKVLNEKLIEIENLNRTNNVITEQLQCRSSEKISVESKVSGKDEEINQLRIVCDDLKKEVSNFEEEKTNLEDCILRTEATLKDKNHVNLILESKITQLESENYSLKSKVDEQDILTRSLSTKVSELELIEKENSDLKNESRDQLSKLDNAEEKFLSVRNSYATLEAKLQERENQIGVLEEKCQSMENNCTDISQELKNKSKLLDNYAVEIENLKRSKLDAEECFVDASEVSADIHVLHEEISQLKQKLEEVKSNHEIALKELDKIHADEVRAKDDQIDSLLDDLKERNVQLDECLVVSEANASGIVQEMEQAKEKLDELTKENLAMKTELSSKSNVDSISSIETDLLNNVYVNNDEDYETRLKKLVKYFAEQMKTKERDYERELMDIKERYLGLEEKLVYEKDQNVSGIEKRLSEQSAAIEEMREHFLFQIQEKDEIIMMLQKENNLPPKSDWDNNWEYEEEAAENAAQPGDDMLRHKSENEVKQFKRSDSMSTNNSVCANGTDSLNRNNFGGSDFTTGLEPTEYLYLRNILLEYMMGKEPVTLAKVIAAVLRFPQELTSQILKREEARQHSTITSPSGKW